MEFRVVSMKSEIHCSSQSYDKDLHGMHFLSMNCIEFDFALKIKVNIITEVSIEFYVKNLRLYHGEDLPFEVTLDNYTHQPTANVTSAKADRTIPDVQFCK